MYALPILVIAILALWAVTYLKSCGKHSEGASCVSKSDNIALLPASYYEKTYMFTQYEKDCYRKLCAMASEFGYCVFAKVPICYIIAPKHNSCDYSRVLRTLMQTDLDFVLCDVNLKTSLVVLIEPSNKVLTSGSIVDVRLDAALEACGVLVLRTAAIDEKTRTWISVHASVVEPSKGQL